MFTYIPPSQVINVLSPIFNPVSNSASGDGRDNDVRSPTAGRDDRPVLEPRDVTHIHGRAHT